MSERDEETDIFDPFISKAEFYIYSRCGGHTTNYVWSALLERKTNGTVWPLTVPIVLKDEYWVPPSWIKKRDGYWLVIDGPFAWQYDQHGLEQVRDSQEYDPKLQKQFEQAKQKVAKFAGRSAIVQDEQLKKILARDYGINWRTPMELAPLNSRGPNVYW